MKSGMPKGRWKKVPIERVYAGFFDGVHGTPKPSTEGPVFLGIKNLTDDGHLDLSDIRHIAEEDYPKWTKRVEPHAGDIVFTYEATLNRYAIIPAGFRGCLGRRLALIRPEPKKVDTRFLFYYFFGQEWRNTIAKNIILGATVERIPIISFPKFEISVPPLPTQRKIAAILSAFDDLIENNARRIKILEEMASSLYREWFVRFRFPGHEHTKMVSSAFGKAPAGWDIRRFSDVVHINPATPVQKEKDKPYVEMAGLATDSMVIECKTVRKGSSGSKFRNGDVLFPRITPSVENGKGGFVQFLAEGTVGLGSTEFIVLRSAELCPEYVYCTSREPDFRENAVKSMIGASGRQRVQEECFYNYLLAKPPKELLARFTQTVSPMFRVVHVLSLKNANLRRTRDLLLPKLISGEIDVSELNIDVGESGQ